MNAREQEQSKDKVKELYQQFQNIKKKINQNQQRSSVLSRNRPLNTPVFDMISRPNEIVVNKITPSKQIDSITQMINEFFIHNTAKIQQRILQIIGRYENKLQKITNKIILMRQNSHEGKCTSQISTFSSDRNVFKLRRLTQQIQQKDKTIKDLTNKLKQNNKKYEKKLNEKQFIIKTLKQSYQRISINNPFNTLNTWSVNSTELSEHKITRNHSELDLLKPIFSQIQLYACENVNLNRKMDNFERFLNENENDQQRYQKQSALLKNQIKLLGKDKDVFEECIINILNIPNLQEKVVSLLRRLVSKITSCSKFKAALEKHLQS